MNKDKIEFLVNAEPIIDSDEYMESIVALLRTPKWYEFTRRRQFPNRVRIVMSEYVKELIRATNDRQTPQMARPDREISKATVPQTNI